MPNTMNMRAILSSNGNATARFRRAPRPCRLHTDAVGAPGCDAGAVQPGPGTVPPGRLARGAVAQLHVPAVRPHVHGRPLRPQPCAFLRAFWRTVRRYLRRGIAPHALL